RARSMLREGQKIARIGHAGAPESARIVEHAELIGGWDGVERFRERVESDGRVVRTEIRDLTRIDDERTTARQIERRGATISGHSRNRRSAEGLRCDGRAPSVRRPR